jgi:hypothetical protein
VRLVLRKLRTLGIGTGSEVAASPKSSIKFLIRTERVATGRSTVISTPSLEVRVIVGVEDVAEDMAKVGCNVEGTEGVKCLYVEKVIC